MKKLVTTLFAVVGLVAATSAFAVSLTAKPELPSNLRSGFAPRHASAWIGCDDANPSSALYQDSNQRIGNEFDFGTGAVLSSVYMAHYGFGFAGPYNYDIEVWDPTSCTFVTAVNNLVAGDAADAIAEETVDLCPYSIHLTGLKLVTIDPNSCIIGGGPGGTDDCYPDVLFDDQTDVLCPYVIRTADTTPVCVERSALNGPFFVEVDLNDCGTPAKHESWGQLKSIYR